MHTRLEPKIFAIFREGYSRKQFYSDLAPGTTVGIVALPLAIAFAIASGVKLEQGLFTAIVAGFVISLLGGPRAQISGPTGAFVVVIYGIVQQYGNDGLAVATLIAGVLLILAMAQGVSSFSSAGSMKEIGRIPLSRILTSLFEVTRDSTGPLTGFLGDE